MTCGSRPRTSASAVLCSSVHTSATCSPASSPSHSHGTAASSSARRESKKRASWVYDVVIAALLPADDLDHAPDEAVRPGQEADAAAARRDGSAASKALRAGPGRR